MGRSAKVGGKNIDRARKQVEARPYKLEEAAELLRKVHYVKFDETVELVLSAPTNATLGSSTGVFD